MAELLEQLRNSLGNAYSVEAELGGGGMARVFVAEEIALHRRVVIKVLPPDVSSAVSMERFKREVLLAARLQHPHIVPLFSVGEVDGMAYYAMPYIEGESLRARLANGPLSPGEAIVILRDVARALAYAHEKNVAHRDIKPDNILIAGTSAVITDFGVAKALSDASVSGDLTTAGVALGTPAYMAPEQVAADPAIDVRADIYSFGVTAYELLTGATPFAGVTGRAAMAAHVLEAPKPVDAVRREIPATLAALVMRCLAKDPDDRPQTASAIVAELDSIPSSGAEPREIGRKKTSGPRFSNRFALAAVVAIGAISILLFWRNRETRSSIAPIDSIAVIPFENSSGSAALAYLEDGITDQVREVLSSIPGVTVKARSSSRQMMHADVHEIGKKLNVAAVLQGTFVQTNGRLLVTAELVGTAGDVSLWSANFDREPSELALIQDSIARAVTERLERPTTAVPAKAMERAARGTSSPAAYNAFLRGRYQADHMEFPQAAESFRQAVAADPKFARAFGYLAMTYTNAQVLGVGSPDSLNALAAATAARALSLDPNVAEAYAAQAFVLMGRRVIDGLVSLGKAAELDPLNADIVSAYALTLAQVGRVKEGLAFAEKARALDPLSANTNGIYGAVMVWARRYDEAISSAKIALVIDPNNVLLHQGLGFFFTYKNEPDSAVKYFETAFRIDSTLFNGRANLVFADAVRGRWDDARRQRNLLISEKRGNSPNYQIAIADIAFGQYEEAITALERAVKEQEGLVGIASLACEPLFDPLKSNPRFVQLARQQDLTLCPATWKGLPPERQ